MTILLIHKAVSFMTKILANIAPAQSAPRPCKVRIPVKEASNKHRTHRR